MTATRSNIPDGPGLFGVEARQSDDDVKQDLELIHVPCGTHLCDIQPDDTLGNLLLVATSHLRECPAPGPLADDNGEAEADAAAQRSSLA